MKFFVYKKNPPIRNWKNPQTNTSIELNSLTNKRARIIFSAILFIFEWIEIESGRETNEFGNAIVKGGRPSFDLDLKEHDY